MNDDNKIVSLEDDDILEGRDPETATEPNEKLSLTEGDDDAFFNQLDNLVRGDNFIILFLGFPAAGKTWLLNRMKWELCNDPKSTHPDIDPPFHEVRVDEASISDGKPVAPLRITSDIEFHRVIEKNPYVLVDVPGEDTRRLINALRSREPDQGQFRSLRRLSQVLKVAGAMIIALPADIAVLGPKMPASDEPDFDAIRKLVEEGKIDPDWPDEIRRNVAYLQDFGDAVGRLAAFRSFLRDFDVDGRNGDLFERSVTRNAILDHLAYIRRSEGGLFENGLDFPTFVALTKADRLFASMPPPDPESEKQLHDDRAELDAGLRATGEGAALAKLAELGHVFEDGRADIIDPWRLLRRTHAKMHYQLIRDFPLMRFDYVTAFYGHTNRDQFVQRQYERYPSHGVIEILEWIGEARRLSKKPPKKLARFAAARRARHFAHGVPKASKSMM